MANKVRVKELTLEGFAPYGTFANLINPKTTKIGAEPIEFYRDMVPQDLGGTSIASFSVCRVLKRPFVINVTEYHSFCAEVTLPLDGDVLVHVGPATPPDEVPLDDFEVFRVPAGTMVCIRPGVWHHAIYAIDTDCVNALIVLPERAYANDCIVYDIPEDEQIEIEL